MKAGNSQIAKEPGPVIRLGNRSRFTLVILILIALLIPALLLNVNIGSVPIAAGDVFRMIWDAIRYGLANLFTNGGFADKLQSVTGSSTESQILFTIRIPRILLAAVLGGALSVSGYLLQVFFRNPIAGPFVLGISSGAKMVVGITLVFLGSFFSGVSSFTMLAAAFIGSLLVTAVVLLFSQKVRNMSMLLVIGIMVSYVIARYKFRYSTLMYALFSAGLMFPMTVGITPLYLMIRNLGLSNSLAGIILPQIAFGLPQTIIILVPFLQSIPMELEEACLLDGCSRLGFFWRMVIPLSMPGVATTGILTFVGSWNGYMLPLFVLSDESKYTLPLGVQMFSSQHSVDTARVLAFTSLAMLPALICFTIFQKKIVGGLTGAVKG